MADFALDNYNSILDQNGRGRPKMDHLDSLLRRSLENDINDIEFRMSSSARKSSFQTAVAQDNERPRGAIGTQNVANRLSTPDNEFEILHSTIPITNSARPDLFNNQESKDPTLEGFDKMQDTTKQSCTPDMILKDSSYRSSAINITKTEIANIPGRRPWRLEEHRQFFNNRPLMRCLDTEEEEFLSDVLFENLLKDVKQKLRRTKSNAGYRGQMQIRAFWDNVRMQLKDEEVEEAPNLLDWPGWERVLEASEVGLI